MSLEENRKIVRKSIEIINTKDLSSIEQMVAPDYVDHTTRIEGLESLKQFGNMLTKAFPPSIGLLRT